jgi:hypothetical protein
MEMCEMKKVLSALLALAMVFSILPAGIVMATAEDYVTGDIIEFGSYPQTKVTDSELIASLNALTPDSNSNVAYGSEKYKRVYLTWYINENVSGNGYSTNTVYWFKYEPIQWRVLSNTNGEHNDELFVMAEKILNTNVYNQVYTNVVWETCSLRTWLNNDFCNTAFNATEQAKILTSVVVAEDCPWSGADGGNNTADKLFLLSHSDVTNTLYGFSSDYTNDSSRIAQGTDYAKCGGLYVNQNSQWWLRNPFTWQKSACLTCYDGRVTNEDWFCGSNVGNTAIGVRPALKMNLSFDTCNVTFDSNGGTGGEVQAVGFGDMPIAPVVTREGYFFYKWSPALTRVTGDTTYTALWVDDIFSPGSLFEFGSYPQTKVTDTGLLAVLNSMTPDAENNVIYNGTKYRRVYFEVYTSDTVGGAAGVGNTHQDNNGYYINTVYWFRYDAIKWRVLSNKNGELFLIADLLLASKEFNPYGFTATKWETCTLRSWLNNTFYNTAFSPFEQTKILSSTIDNSNGINTIDKLFLPSRAEVTNTSYGFNPDIYTKDNARKVSGTDFSYSNNLMNLSGTSQWWLRSNSGDYNGYIVDWDGDAYNNINAYYTDIGVRPAFKMDLASITHNITFDANGGTGGEVQTVLEGIVPTPPAVTKEGHLFAGWSPEIAATSADTTYTAQWVPIPTYQITFDTNGGTGGETQAVLYGETPIAPTVARDGYVFLGWEPQIIAATADTTYTAQWHLLTYHQITFDANGGTGGEVQTLGYLETPIPPVVTKPNCVFNGWTPAVVPVTQDVTYTAQWIEYIELGSYPQTRVTDTGLLTALNAQTPDAQNNVEYGGNKYRQVYFETPTGCQEINGYLPNTVYWFKYEPIKWRVFANTGGEYFAVSEKILDSRAYNQIQEDITWETCGLRAWLNDDFYNAAFTPIDQAKIVTSNIATDDNPHYGTDGGNDTFDKLFLLSLGDVTNPAFGFDSDHSARDNARIAHGTDFAKSSGLYFYPDSPWADNSTWWLRSPGSSQYYSSAVHFLRDIYFLPNIYITTNGVRPAIKIDFYSEITFDANGGIGGETQTVENGTMPIPPAVTREGYSFAGWTPEITAATADTTYTAQWISNTVKSGDLIEFGLYPQAEVTDTGLLDILNLLPRDAENDAGYDGAKYHFFNSHWYQWEPVQWRILSNANGELLTVADKILAPRAYHDIAEPVTWETSAIRTQLNGEFCDSVFTSSNRLKIKTSFVVNADNPTTGADGGNNTEDKIFLLGIDEVNQYGLCTAERYPTEYAKATGVFVNSFGNADWWLRSPGYNTTFAAYVHSDGVISQDINSWGVTKALGIRPALKIELSSIKYSINFDANNGVGGEMQTVAFGDIPIVPTVTRTGYSFMGWVPAVTPFACEDITYTAQWEPSAFHQITFDANGGIGGEVQAVPYDVMPAAPVVTREGYVFTGWLPAITTASGNAVYTAQWHLLTYHQITFDASGGRGSETFTAAYGDTLSPPAVSKTGYCFMGWLPAISQVTENTTYTAQWVKKAYSAGDIIEFGSYPQTRVTDAGLLSILNAAIPDINGNVVLNGARYKRMFYSVVNGNQAVNGYYANTVYWFQYEPIQWRVLSNTAGELFVISEKILEASVYNQDFEEVTWETSDLRSWLNNSFINTAFTPAEQAEVFSTTVINEDNPWDGTGGGNDTVDKLFLLSFSELMNPAYGFSANGDEDIARRALGTEFGKCTGLLAYDSSPFTGNSDWWLRSPGTTLYDAGKVNGRGSFESYYDANNTFIGVRPAFRMDLATFDITFDANGGTGSEVQSVIKGVAPTPPTVTKENYTLTGWSPAITPASGNTTYTALWELNTYQITFNANGGIGGAMQSITHGNMPVAPEASRLGYRFIGWIPALAVATADTTYTAVWMMNPVIAGDIIEFGSYPQTKVTDTDLISALDALTPDADNNVIYGANKYKRVYFSQYTTRSGGSSTSPDNTYQDDNGYFTNTVYWFKYEPVRWRVLSNTAGELFVIAESILASRVYQEVMAEVTWEASDMRTWLNGAFYNSAFSPVEQAQILTSPVTNADNPWYGTDGGNDTTDKLFLLACGEAMNVSLGFDSDSGAQDPARMVQGTDYAKSEGLFVSTGGAFAGNSSWRLRTPAYMQENTCRATEEGLIYSSDYVPNSDVGVRPAFKMTIPPEPLTATAGSGCVIDRENSYIYGLETGITSLEDYVNVADGYVLECILTPKGFGTGTVVNVKIEGLIIESFTIIYFGDINGDSLTRSIDALMALQTSAQVISLNSSQMMAGDVNHSGSITSVDALKILQYSAGIITAF